VSELKAEMKFEIGDIVYFAATQHTDSCRPRRFVVYERFAQECHGGIQKLYRVGGEANMVSEPLLTSVEPEYRPRSPEAIASQIADELQLSAARDKVSDKRWEAMKQTKP
jgi:hypothetical protein